MHLEQSGWKRRLHWHRRRLGTRQHTKSRQPSQRLRRRFPSTQTPCRQRHQARHQDWLLRRPLQRFQSLRRAQLRRSLLPTALRTRQRRPTHCLSRAQRRSTLSQRTCRRGLLWQVCRLPCRSSQRQKLRLPLQPHPARGTGCQRPHQHPSKVSWRRSPPPLRSSATSFTTLRHALPSRRSLSRLPRCC